MNAITKIINSAKTNYLVTTLAVLGMIAFVSAGIIAWPALAYLGTKLIS